MQDPVALLLEVETMPVGSRRLSKIRDNQTRACSIQLLSIRSTTEIPEVRDAAGTAWATGKAKHKTITATNMTFNVERRNKERIMRSHLRIQREADRGHNGHPPAEPARPRSTTWTATS
jgi:hypothetical protein